VAEHLISIDSILSALTDDEYYAVASSSSRLALSELPRRLPETIWDRALDLTQRTQLLIAHFTTDPIALDPLPALSDERVQQLASPMFAAWPIARAINTRMFQTPNATLLGALAKLVGAVINPEWRSATHREEFFAAILEEPACFPALWVLEAERQQSMGNRETPLSQFALEEGWLPKVPRL
jgi:hypothetical protein